jgi:hypothetical protein
MLNAFPVSFRLMADSSGAVEVMRQYVTPTMQTLTALAAIASVFFIVFGGILYMSSRGNPEKLDQAKRVLKNALIGLVIVLGAGTLTAILTGAMGHTASPSSATLPNLQAITPASPSSGLIEIIINAVTGLLNNIIQAVGAPFLAALGFFTKSTPLMTSNGAVFNLWLAMVGITDVLFVVIVALLGFHIMSAATFGLDEIEFKHLLPRVALIFLLLNTSIFIIDGIIALSNALITAVSAVGGSQSVWEVLTTVVGESGGQGVAALLVMLVFVIFSVILLIYYVGRLVTLFVGTVLAPIVCLVWLVPGFRDFSETAIKTYITTIFTLFVHVVILTLAASLFAGMSATTGNDAPNTLMAMVVGLATVIALLKTQGLMMQFSYVSLGARSTRQLGSTFMNGVSYLGGRARSVASTASNKTSSRSSAASSKTSTAGSSTRRNSGSATYTQPKGSRSTASKQKTGTYAAPNYSSSTRTNAKNKATSKATNKETKA